MFLSPQAPQSLCSPVSIFPAHYIPQSLCSPVLMFRSLCSPLLCSPLSMFPSLYVPRSLYSPSLFVSQSLCSGPYVPRSYVLHYLCSSVSVFQYICSPILCHLVHMFPIPMFPAYISTYYLGSREICDCLNTSLINDSEQFTV